MDKILKLGMHIEMIKSGLSLDAPENIEKKYVTSLHEIIDEDTLVITNPTLKARLIPLHPGERYDGYFFNGGKIYMAKFVVEKSMLEGHVRIVRIRILSNLVKYERRQFYRLPTTQEIRYLQLTPDNMEDFRVAVQNNNLLQMKGFANGTTIDISGGGIKFSSKEQLNKDGMIIVHMVAEMTGKVQQYVFLGKVLSSEQLQDDRYRFIHRLQFVDFKQEAREELVQYIFQCERERLKKHNSRN